MGTDREGTRVAGALCSARARRAQDLTRRDAVVDRIEISGLRVFGRHGVFDWEKEQGQDFTLDLALEVDLRPAGKSDDLTDTVDYGVLAERIAREVEDTQFTLIEALAQHLSDVVLADGRVRSVDIRIGKPDVALSVELVDVAVHIRREREAG